MRQIRVFLLLSFVFVINHAFLYAADSKPEIGKEQAEKEQKQEIKPEITSPEKDKPDTGEEKKKAAMDEQKKSAQIKTIVPDKAKKSPRKIPDGPVLQNPVLTQEFRDSFESSGIENGILYFFYGAVSGGLMGLGGGLSFYKTSGDFSPLFIPAGIMAATGGVSGVLISILERSTRNPTIGAQLFEYSWYGLMGGALIGGLAGIIPYTANKDIVSLLNWVGYGAFGGLAGGVVLYFFAPQKYLKNLYIDINPREPKFVYRYQF